MVTNSLIKGVIVTNIGQTAHKFRLQVEEFLVKSKLMSEIELTEVLNHNVISYLSINPDVSFCLFWDKDIYLAMEIEKMGLRVFNSSHAIAMCDDKAFTAVALATANLAQPRYFVLPLIFYGNIFEHYEKYKDSLLILGFPLVVKHRQGSFGDQVFLARNEDELKVLLNTHGHKQLIVQQYLKNTAGTDYRVNVVGEKAILTIKRQNPNDFRSNINQGGKATSFEPTEQMETLAISATKALKADFAGVDIMFDDNNKPVVIEVNSNMRTVAVNKVSKIDLTSSILNYIVGQLKTVPQ